MENIRKVTQHQLAYFQEHQLTAQIPELVLTQDGNTFHKDEAGNYWRVFTYIADTISIEEVQTTAQAYEAARMFGFFVRTLQDLPATELAETIPDFHNAAWRRSNFDAAVKNGLAERIQHAADEIDFFQSQSYIASKIVSLLEQKAIPWRIVHNDTKISNVLMHAVTGQGVCAIDLDTVMPGTLLYDFGDMMRTFLSPAAEDETDLSKVQVRMPIFEALTVGYWTEVGPWITSIERENLLFGGHLMTYIMGIRFLTDYLQGDVYYKTHRPGQNLDRCRTQMCLLQEMKKQEEAMQKIIASLKV